MNLKFIIYFVSFLCIDSTSVDDESRRLFEEVGNRLKEFDAVSQNQGNVEWLANSDKLGFGYNLFAGSPICYSGVCQTNEFTHPIFILNYISPAPGSCTNKLIPNNVQLDCVPSTSPKTDVDIIDTAEKLHQSISKKIQLSIEAKYKSAAFSYIFSRETQYMLDNIVKEGRTSLFTSAEISYVKLSMFELFMELSENFRYVIEHMPCCEVDSATEDYVKTYIIDHFGIFYIGSMHLGGVTHQNFFIGKTRREPSESQEVQIMNEAKLSFGKDWNSASASSNVSNTQKYSSFDSFNQEILSKSVVTVEKSSYFTTIQNWLQIIADNPAIIKYEVRDIFRLLTTQRFPNDLLITNKSKLIETIVDKQFNNRVYCYNNCGSSGIHGTCVSTGYFNFGTCKCMPGWTGPDCQTIDSPKVLHGTICGFDRSILKVNCNGLRPWNGCPTGWAPYVWTTDLTVCYKYKTEVGYSLPGTLCGLHSYQSKPTTFQYDINCQNTTYIDTGTCPIGYDKHNTNIVQNTVDSISYTRKNAVCASSSSARQIVKGTLCGMQIIGTTTGPSCDGYNPGEDRCPSDYILKNTAFNGQVFHVCVKL